MSMMVSFVLSFFPRDVLDEILNLIESVSEDFPSYSYAETERKCTSSAFTCTFPTMTIMTDKSPRHTTPVAYKK